MRKVRITGVPKAKEGGSTSGANEGLQRFMSGKKKFDEGLNKFSAPDFEVNKTLKGVDRSQANIEAEGGEYAVVPGEGGVPESYKIVGPSHSKGGVPLNLAQDSFIFSDTKDMRIKDKELLKEFGVSLSKKDKKGKTPADIAKKYDLNEYKKILLDPNSDHIERETAEKMIENYNMKLGKLALVQEAKKGFPQNAPAIALPYLQMINVDASDFDAAPEGYPTMAAYGAGVSGDPSQYSYKYGGENKNMAKRFPGLSIAKSGIEIKPENKGKFTAKANAAGMSVQAFASKVLNAPEGVYSPATRKQANFAKNAAGWKKEHGGEFSGAFWDSIMQTGGPIIEDDYQTEADYRRGAIPLPTPNYNGTGVELPLPDFLSNNYQTEADYNASRMQFVEPEVWNQMYGTPRQIRQAQFDAIRDPEAQGLESQYAVPMQRDRMTFRSSGSKTEERINTSNKPTLKYNIPKGSTVHEEGTPESNIKDGDYIKREGKYYKVKTGPLKLDRTSMSGKENYKPTYGSIEEDVKKAKEIIKKGKVSGAFTEKNGKINIARDAKDYLSLEDKDFLTKVFSYGTDDGKLGALDLKVGTQSSNGDSFYGFVDPELIEYRYWKANNPDKSVKDYSKLGPEEQVANRKDFLTNVGKYTPEEISKFEQEGKLVDPGMLYSKDFMKGTEGSPGFTERNQTLFGEEGFRPGHGDDYKFGLEHVDEYSITKPFEYEELQGEAEQPKPEYEQPEYITQSQKAPWWAQDTIKAAGLVGERAGIKKYLPHSYPIDLMKPDVVYYDPSRALAANAEQQNIAAQSVRSFGDSRKAAAQMSGIQGQGAANVANILGDYENKNVGVANQYLNRYADISNQENLANVQRMQNLYDQTTVANQQYDNAIREANRNILDQFVSGITNATQSQSLNLLYPEFQHDPERGGISYFTGQGRPQTVQIPFGSPSAPSNDNYNQFLKETGLENNPAARKQWYAETMGPMMASSRRRGNRGFNPFAYPG